MISISGVNNQTELEQLPYFNKNEAMILIGKVGRNLDAKIQQLIKKGYLTTLKKGLYTSSVYYNLQKDKGLYLEYISNILRYPSYLSLEYVLYINNIIPEEVVTFTSVTIKTPRFFANQLGTFSYRQVKESLFCGYITKEYGSKTILIATPAKALFDYLYLKRNIRQSLIYELQEGLRINWDEFGKNDLEEFRKYVFLSKSLKMQKILDIIEKTI